MPGQKKISESRTGGILAQNIFCRVENFAKKFFAPADFKREVFVLSSGECVTAAFVVQGMRFMLHWRRTGAGQGVQGSEVRVKRECVSWRMFFRAA
jgi:hypothetical protein